MKIGRRRALVVALAWVASAVPEGLSAQALQRAMYVTVLDDRGAPVPDLGLDDFQIREDNVVREVLRVSAANQPMHVAVLVDNSQAAEAFVRDYRLALPVFTESMLAQPAGGRHLVSIIGVADRPTIFADYTVSPTALTKGIGRIFSTTGSASYLLDGIIEVSQGIQKRRPDRPVIVVLTTDGPELSGRHYQTVLEPLRASGAMLHVIAVGRQRNTAQDRDLALTIGTRETGGRYDMLLSSSALTARLKDLAAELTSQYLVTYGRPQTLIPPQRITVRATRPKLVARGTPAPQPQTAIGEDPR